MSIAMVIPEEMRKKYLERRQRDFKLLESSLADGDLSEFLKLGHQLKGNAATFGYEELAELGRRMEVAGESKDRATAESCLEEYRKWLFLHPAQPSGSAE
jgi:HPt (histidine-containing phosphotransfer) domain-containing protein